MVFKTLKYVMYSSPSLDNFIYKLCYRWTVLLLLVFSLVVTCRLRLGDSFECAGGTSFPRSYENAKCYDGATYMYPEKVNIFEQDSSPRVSTHTLRRYQTYYSWVNLFFLVQAFIFYLPHLLWKSYEGGYMHRLTAGVQKLFDNEEKRGLEICYLAKCVLATRGNHKVFTCIYMVCESCNFIIAIGQILFLIYFFNITGVPDSSLPLSTWSDFRNFYFPRTGVCQLKRFDRGDIVVEGTLCEMHMSGLYMKMFLFLYAWYILLTIMTGMVLIYRIALSVLSFRVFAAKSFTCLAERPVIKSLCCRLSFADWFFMTRIQKTMIDIDFSQMIDKIAIASQGLDKQKDEDRRSPLVEYGMKEFDNCDTASPV